jgi:hypothetical protein
VANLKTAMTRQNYKTRLSLAECQALLEAAQHQPLFGQNMRLVGTISSDNFCVTSTSDLMLSGVFTPALVGRMRETERGVLVSLEVKRRLSWLLPGITFSATGAVGLAWLIVSAIQSEIGSAPSLIWVLGVGILPFGVIWLATGFWLMKQFDVTKTRQFVESLLDLVPDQ